jgi:hypothetical protein
MKRAQSFVITAAVFALTSSWAAAQDGDLDVTMTVLPENADQSEAVTAAIDLPMDEAGEYIPAEEGVENSQVGLDTANLARQDGRAFGEEARELAEENRERFGRGGGAPSIEELIPDGVPAGPETLEFPETPDLVPELPEAPAGPGGV